MMCCSVALASTCVSASEPTLDKIMWQHMHVCIACITDASSPTSQCLAAAKVCINAVDPICIALAGTSPSIRATVTNNITLKVRHWFS